MQLAASNHETGVLILPYHGEPGLPKLLKDQPVDVIEKAALWLKAQGYEKIGLWGISFLRDW